MTFKQAAEDILFSQEDYVRIKRGIDHLHEIYGKETGIVVDDLIHHKMQSTERGWIVSPVHAAHCLIDLARTTCFLRGIHQAIAHYSSSDEKVRILYAGCGPYATLITPLTAFFSPRQLNVTLLDINEISLKAVKDLFQKQSLLDYVHDFIQADATDPDIEFDGKFDIIISETMQAGLRRECQVAVTRNLVRFLKEDGTFIPQRIRLDLFLAEGEDTGGPKQNKIHLGTAYDLNYTAVPEVGFSTTVEIPGEPLNQLWLHTHIDIFEKEQLSAFQSGLTMPIILDVFNGNRPASVRLWYREGADPGIEYEYFP